MKMNADIRVRETDTTLRLYVISDLYTVSLPDTNKTADFYAEYFDFDYKLISGLPTVSVYAIKGQLYYRRSSTGPNARNMIFCSVEGQLTVNKEFNEGHISYNVKAEFDPSLDDVFLPSKDMKLDRTIILSNVDVLKY